MIIDDEVAPNESIRFSHNVRNNGAPSTKDGKRIIGIMRVGDSTALPHDTERMI